MDINLLLLYDHTIIHIYTHIYIYIYIQLYVYMYRVMYIYTIIYIYMYGIGVVKQQAGWESQSQGHIPSTPNSTWAKHGGSPVTGQV